MAKLAGTKKTRKNLVTSRAPKAARKSVTKVDIGSSPEVIIERSSAVGATSRHGDGSSSSDSESNEDEAQAVIRESRSPTPSAQILQEAGSMRDHRSGVKDTKAVAVAPAAPIEREGRRTRGQGIVQITPQDVHNTKRLNALRVEAISKQRSNAKSALQPQSKKRGRVVEPQDEVEADEGVADEDEIEVVPIAKKRKTAAGIGKTSKKGGRQISKLRGSRQPSEELGSEDIRPDSATKPVDGRSRNSNVNEPTTEEMRNALLRKQPEGPSTGARKTRLSKSNKAITPTPRATDIYEFEGDDNSADSQSEADSQADDSDAEEQQASKVDKVAIQRLKDLMGLNPLPRSLPKSSPIRDMLPTLNGIFLEADIFVRETFAEQFLKRGEHEFHAIKNIRIRRDKIADLYREFPSATDVEAAREEIARQIGLLVDHVWRLDIESFGAIKDRHEFFKQVYLFVFIDLICVLNDAMHLHVAQANDDFKQMTWELTCWYDLCNAVHYLYIKVRTEPWKQSNILKIAQARGKKSDRNNEKKQRIEQFIGVRELRSKLGAPFEKLAIDLLNRRETLIRDHRTAAQAEEWAQLTQKEAEEEETRKRLYAQYDGMFGRLRLLFLHRMKAARVRDRVRGRFSWTWSVKSFEDWLSTPELDANGDPIERVPIFSQRAPGSRPPASNSAMSLASPEWSKLEKNALFKALKADSGPNVFKDIFYLHGHPDGVLYMRTVPEILRKAKTMQDFFLAEEGAKENPKLEWVRAIPDLDLLEILKD